MESIRAGLHAERSLKVADEHTARQWGSGAVAVFSTPHMVALMEGAAVDAVDALLPSGQQTVGTRVSVEHLAATPIGLQVTARAELTEVDGRVLTFRVVACDEAGTIGEGSHQRVIVDVARFMARAEARGR
jgi:fluoroacetyl-CoA thioesterase